MDSATKAVGTIEAAVREHHPTAAVLFEAGALDRELRAKQRSWEALLRGVESFVSHYPAVLLHSPAAMLTLGRACLEGVRDAPGVSLRTKSASLLVALQSGVAEEALRQGAEKIPREVPEGLRFLIQSLAQEESVPWHHGHLLPPLLGLGKQMLLLGGEGRSSEVWFELIDPLTDLLLKITRRRVEGEPTYDGRWDGSKSAPKLRVSLLGPVRRERVAADLGWLDRLEQELSEGARPGVDVFIELSAYQRRDEREATWEAWFRAVAENAMAGGLSAGSLRHLCIGIAGWIEQARDHRFISKLATILRDAAPEVASANGEAGLVTALDTFGKAIVNRLEREAGRGEIDPALESLRVVVAELIRRLLPGTDPAVVAEAVELGTRLRTGPITGQPFSCEDVVWRMTAAVSHPEVADRFLISLLTGFSLEDALLHEAGPVAGQAGQPYAAKGEGPGPTPPRPPAVGQALGDLLGRRWQRDLLHPVRAVLRVIPLSPFHLGSPTTRAHLMALDPEDRRGSYLHDLKQHILSRTGPENLGWVESVLNFWRTAEPEFLDDLASPESLNALPAQAQGEHLDQVRQLIERLSRYVPLPEKTGVRWLARMPQTYYQEETLLKVAGFPGCSSQAVSLLAHLLNVYRALVEKYQPMDRPAGTSPGQTEDLLERSSRLLKKRVRLGGKLFADGGMEGLSPTQRFQQFTEDLDLVREVEGLLEELSNQELRLLDRQRLKEAVRILGQMLMNATLSGLGPEELASLAERFFRTEVPEGEIFPLLRRVAWLTASTRNRLAERLQPHLEDSARRLLENPLARPAASYRELLAVHRHRGVERVALELGEVLVDDLLCADGGFLLLEEFLHRMLHLLEKY